MPNLAESQSDGIMVADAKRHYSSFSCSTTSTAAAAAAAAAAGVVARHPISRAGSLPQRAVESDGYCSSHSSSEDELTQVQTNRGEAS